MSVFQEVEDLPSIASPASPGLSAPPSGENTVARTGVTTCPGGAVGLSLRADDDDGVLSPRRSLSSPPPTSPKIRPSTERSEERRVGKERRTGRSPDRL